MATRNKDLMDIAKEAITIILSACILLLGIIISMVIGSVFLSIFLKIFFTVWQIMGG